jgi:hypothetical protein
MKLRTSLLVAVALAVAVAVLALAPAPTVHASHTEDSNEEKKEKEDVFQELNDGPKPKTKFKRTKSISVKNSNLDNEDETFVTNSKRKESSGEPKKKAKKFGRSESHKLKSKKTGVNEDDVKSRRSSKLKKVNSKNSNVDDTDNNSTKRRKSKLDKSKRKSFSVKKLSEIEIVNDDDTPPNTNVPPPNTNVQNEAWRNWPGGDLDLRPWIYNFFRAHLGLPLGDLAKAQCSENAPENEDMPFVQCKLPTSRGIMTKAQFTSFVNVGFPAKVQLPDDWILQPKTKLEGSNLQEGIRERTLGSPYEAWVLSAIYHAGQKDEREIQVFIPASKEEMPDNN